MKNLQRINGGKGMEKMVSCKAMQTCMQVRKQVRMGHGKTDWFQIGKAVCQVCILSPCLFNFYAEYIMRNAGLEETQAGNQDCWEKYQ